MNMLATTHTTKHQIATMPPFSQSIVYQVDVCLFETVALLIQVFQPTTPLGIRGGVVTLQCSLFFSSVYVPSASFKMPSANYKLPSANFMDF